MLVLDCKFSVLFLPLPTSIVAPWFLDPTNIVKEAHTHTLSSMQPRVLSLESPVVGQTKRLVEVRFSVRLPMSSLTMHY